MIVNNTIKLMYQMYNIEIKVLLFINFNNVVKNWESLPFKLFAYCGKQVIMPIHSILYHFKLATMH